MWIYSQRTGALTGPEPFVWTGYSGAGLHKNNPDSQHLHNQGPIPRGRWQIGAPHDTATHGPFVLPLTPEASTDVFGRGGFLVHGDSLTDPGNASQGCIIVPREAREAIAASGDMLLLVTA